jgi:hypothetical protein
MKKSAFKKTEKKTLHRIGQFWQLGITCVLEGDWEAWIYRSPLFDTKEKALTYALTDGLDNMMEDVQRFIWLDENEYTADITENDRSEEDYNRLKDLLTGFVTGEAGVNEYKDASALMVAWATFDVLDYPAMPKPGSQ